MLNSIGQIKVIHVAQLLAAIYLIAGLFVLDDFGVSYDEETQRLANGIVNFNYIVGEDSEELLNASEKYHGPAFEILLVLAEKVSGFDDTRSVYLLRHTINFLTFYLSILVMFFLGRRCFESEHWGLFAALIYALSPRFFAESFYNGKDIILVAWVTFSLYTLFRFSKNTNYKWAFVHALVTGFAIDVRVIGIFVPVATVGLIAYQQLFSARRTQSFRKTALVVCFYLVIQAFSVVAFWPILWEGPWHHFTQAFIEMSSFVKRGEMRFLGELISFDQIPWFYLPLWMGITIPLPFLLLAAVGIIGLVLKLVRFRSETLWKYRYDFLFLSMLVFPLLFIIGMRSVVYDGWRHIYFLYVPMVLVAARGGMFLWKHVQKIGMPIFFILVFAMPVYAILSYHPHQYAYFNVLARTYFPALEKSFEMDYWGLAYRQGLEKILELEDESPVRVQSESAPGYDNRLILPEVDRERLVYQGSFSGVGTYVMMTNRATLRTKLNLPSKLVYQVETPAGPILSVYRTVDSLHIQGIVCQENWDFEEDEGKGIVSVDNAPSGKMVNRIGDGWDYGKTLKHKVDTIAAEGALGVDMTAWLQSEKPLADLSVVVSVDRNGENAHWSSYGLKYMFNRANLWEQWNWGLILNDLKLQVGDEISIYFWSPSGDIGYQDDVQIRVVSFKESEPYFPMDSRSF